jgi:Aspartyl protease
MKAFVVAIGLAALLCAPASAAADVDRGTGPPPGIQPTSATLADVLAANAKAEGKPLDAFATRVLEWSFRDSGSDGVERTIWRGADYKTTDTFGPVIMQEGRLNGLGWRENYNGQTVLQWGLHPEEMAFEQALRLARGGSPGDFVKLLGEVQEPVAAYVVSVAAPTGRPTWLLFDKSTGQLVQQQELMEGIRWTTTYADFRSEYGATFAHAQKVTNGEPADDQEYKLTSFRVNVPVEASALAIPREHQNRVEFPAGMTSDKLQSEFFHFVTPFGQFGTIVVRVTVNGQGLDFALDSGASSILIDKGVADRLGLKQFKTYSIKPGDPPNSSIALVPEMDIADLKMKNIFVDAVPFTARPKATSEIVGLLGYDFLASVGLKIDFDDETITAFPPGAIRPPEGTIPAPIQLDDFVPRVGVTVGSSWSDRFIFDLGASTVLIFPEFAAKHKGDLRDQGLGGELSHYIPDFYFGTVYGAADSHATQIRRFTFGIPFDEFIAYVVTGDSGIAFEDYDGLVGYPFYHYFNLYFDYENSRIMLEKNKAYTNAKKEPGT